MAVKNIPRATPDDEKNITISKSHGKPTMEDVGDDVTEFSFEPRRQFLLPHNGRVKKPKVSGNFTVVRSSAMQCTKKKKKPCKTKKNYQPQLYNKRVSSIYLCRCALSIDTIEIK